MSKFSNSVRVIVKVITKASKNEVITEPDGSLKVKLTAAPENGKANAALIKLLAGHYKIRVQDMEIIKGHKSTRKIILIAN